MPFELLSCHVANIHGPLRTVNPRIISKSGGDLIAVMVRHVGRGEGVGVTGHTHTHTHTHNNERHLVRRETGTEQPTQLDECRLGCHVRRRDNARLVEGRRGVKGAKGVK